ncbi:MAG: hypothetical protein K0R25_152 [Rickettsiaceae bacterium]|jgi:hypothetical protein|nr:hypothetical protein [Rickettsiaceae bacterium]
MKKFIFIFFILIASIYPLYLIFFTSHENLAVPESKEIALPEQIAEKEVVPENKEAPKEIKEAVSENKKEVNENKEDISPIKTAEKEVTNDNKNIWPVKTLGKEEDFGYRIMAFKINDKNVTSIQAKAGEKITIETDYQVWNSLDCPACITQLVLILQGDNNSAHCIYEGIPKTYPQEVRKNIASIIAPSQRGNYEIYLEHQLQYNCIDAVNNAIGRLKSGDKRGLIANIMVI